MKSIVKEWRDKFGFTQEDAATIMGVTRVTVSRWEADGVQPRMVALLIPYLMKEKNGGWPYQTREVFFKGQRAWLNAKGLLPPSRSESSQEKQLPPQGPSPDE